MAQMLFIKNYWSMAAIEFQIRYLLNVKWVGSFTFCFILCIVGLGEVVGCYSREGSGSFDAARSTCQNIDSHLIGISSALENSAVASE